MAKQKTTYYFAIKGKASTFYDITTGLQVHAHTPGKISTTKLSKRIREAMTTGHITQINEAEYNSLIAAKDNTEKVVAQADKMVKDVTSGKDVTDLKSLKVDQLRKRALELEGLTDAQVKAIKDMKKDDLIDFIEEYEAPEEEDDEDDEEDEEDED